jgi:hypothetical protein
MMKRSVIFAVALAILVAAPISAQNRGTTRENYFFCASLPQFKELISFVTAKDLEAVDKYIATHPCGMLKAGVGVFWANAPGLGIIKFRMPGDTQWFYTHTEAIRK